MTKKAFELTAAEAQQFTTAVVAWARAEASADAALTTALTADPLKSEPRPRRVMGR